MRKVLKQMGGAKTLKDLRRGLDTIRQAREGNPTIAGVAYDSRAVMERGLFVAIGGAAADGHGFIQDAVRRGAAAVVCQRWPGELPPCSIVQVADSRRALSRIAHNFHGRPSRSLRVTGVTGTDGKTSTTEILRRILNEAGRPAGSIGTLGFRIDDAWLDTSLTTPDPLSLHSTFERMLQVGMTDVCMEVSSHSLIQHRVADVAFDAAILTNITQDHLDTHGTREEYARAKRILFEMLPPDAVAVLPAYGEFTEDFAAATRANVLTYGIDALADVRGTILSQGVSGMDLLVRTPFEFYRVQTHLIGDYNCLNILAAATVAFGFGAGGEVVSEALRGFGGVPGRLEKVTVPGRIDLPGVCVDYAHTPAALEKVLSTLRPMTHDRLICVVGCGGDRDRGKRPKMGRIAAELADVAILTADNSRTEKTEDIIDEMLAGVPGGRGVCRVEPDRRRAIELALEAADSPDCMVAICGRGCEKYQKIGGHKIPFDDRVVARELMERVAVRRRKTA
jgi:UDP-N-acetylmuramoyl-L-alanyl-D-glutamate--2,6-diaminopimelate ligase